MKALHEELVGLGWNKWFETQSSACKPAESIARVAAVDRELFLLIDREGSFRAKLPGSALQHPLHPDELPCVGDWVCVGKPPGEGTALIRSIFERQTSLRRKSAGTASGYQMIAANVDCVFIVQSCHYDFNVNRLERYLVMVMDGGAVPCILLTKSDLVEPAVLSAQIEEIRSAGISAPIVPLSSVTGDGLGELESRLHPGKSYCFVGSSGVGKSTLVNRLKGHEVMETGTVSGTGEGRHTTVRRELILLENGALLIDNPGMREFGIIGADAGLTRSYTDISTLAAGCRYRDCTHTNEPGCAILEALQAGTISARHIDNYRKLLKESEFHDMSYAEKRRKDRDFGKFKHTVGKQRKNR